MENEVMTCEVLKSDAQMKVVKLSYRVEKEDEKKYLRVPLDMPKNVERIDISYTYEGDNASSTPLGEKNVIDIAVLAPDGNDVGATGSSHRNISFGEVYSSPGFKRLPLVEGTWYIILGAYLLVKKGVNVNYLITYHFKTPRWYRGDTHFHTTNSDGKLTIPEAAELAKKYDFEFLFITDHNNTAQTAMPIVDGLTLIPGVELTNYMGHINYLGCEKPYSGSYAANSFDEFLALNEEAKASGAMRVINHPKCSLCPWLWQFDFPIEGVEVWNGPMRRDNINAIKFWHEELLKGRKLVATGGSDYHNLRPLFGMPSMYIFANSASQADIMDALKKGRATILNSTKSPLLYMTAKTTAGETACQGGTIKLVETDSVTVVCEKLKRKQTLVVYQNDKPLVTHKQKSSKKVELNLKVTETGFVRAEVRYKPSIFSRFVQFAISKFTQPNVKQEKIDTLVYSLTNPIYFE